MVWNESFPRQTIDFPAGNATTDDLWEALSKVSSKDVNKFMVILSFVLYEHRNSRLKITRIHGLERLGSQYLQLLKSPASLEFVSPVFY